MPLPPIDVSVCVPVWRLHGAPNIHTLARELEAAAAGLSTELVVVLNGLKRREVRVPEHANVTELGVNRGVPVAWNLAARVSGGRTLAFVNDDVSLGPGSLRMLHEALENNREAGVAGPVGTRWDIGSARHLDYVSLDGLAPGTQRPCEVLSGFFFATPRKIYEATSGFDEAYSPCGFEEVDYCTAVRLELGLLAVAVGGVPFGHDFGISAARPWRRVRFDGRSESLGSIAKRNRRRFRAKWAARGDTAASGP
jgi:GT2 family glycosyltransferase